MSMAWGDGSGSGGSPRGWDNARTDARGRPRHRIDCPEQIAAAKKRFRLAADAPAISRSGGARVCLVTFMHDDLGYFDDETCRLEPIDNPFGSKV
jgi:hypothetical protein